MNYTRYGSPRAILELPANWRNPDISDKVGRLQGGRPRPQWPYPANRDHSGIRQLSDPPFPSASVAFAATVQVFSDRWDSGTSVCQVSVYGNS